MLKTHDGVLHKLDIIYNDSHRLAENKDKSLIFVVENGNREYFFNSKQAELLNYQIVDKIIRAISVDTRRTQSLYHHLVSRQTPSNLKPSEIIHQVPHWGFPSLNSNAFIWKYLNRTVYRAPYFEGADAAFLWHLRNKRDKLNVEEKALRDEFKLHFVYPDELFYQTHKISQRDFLSKLREAGSAKKVKKLIDKLYDDDSVSGRRGVKPLSEGIALVKRKMIKKERHRKFAQRLTGHEEGMSYQQLRQSGILKGNQMY